MKLKNNKVVGLMTVLFISSTIYLCYYLLSHELPNINSRPVANVSSLWTPPRQYDGLSTHASNRTRLRYRKRYNITSAESSNNDPQPVHHKLQTNTAKKRFLKFWGGDNSPNRVSLRPRLAGHRVLEQRASVVQQVCRRYNVHQAPVGAERPLRGGVLGNYLI